jgi:hypothetical protein
MSNPAAVVNLGQNPLDAISEAPGVNRLVHALGSIGSGGSETQLTAGQKTAANSIPVTLNSESTDSLGGMYVVGSRGLVVPVSLALGQSSYSSLSASLGGLLSISTGFANTLLYNPMLRLVLPTRVVGVTGGFILFCMWLKGNPTSSTFTDGTVISVNSADEQNVVHQVASQALGTVGANNTIVWTSTGPSKLKTDSAGKIYCAVSVDSGTVSVSSAPQTVAGQLEALY